MRSGASGGWKACGWRGGLGAAGLMAALSTPGALALLMKPSEALHADGATKTIWRLDQTATIAGHASSVTGEPRVVDSPHGKAVAFDGARDGLFLPVNPLAGWAAFTIEVLLAPAAGGQPEQRFLHLEDEAGSRALLETRQTPEGQWALDTFLLSGQSRLTLLDRDKLHPPGSWYWVALRYDGREMASFVDGRQELAGSVRFPPMKEGQTSLGVRQNKVSWFKGAIREVRFHPSAIPVEALRRQR